MIIDDTDFHLDLLLSHRPLKRLVAVELKTGTFDPRYEGQMKLYLKWLDRYEREPGKEAPIGLILCAETSREQVERRGKNWSSGSTSSSATPGSALPGESCPPRGKNTDGSLGGCFTIDAGCSVTPDRCERPRRPPR